MIYDIRFAGIHIRTEIPFEVRIRPESEAFFRTGEYPDYHNTVIFQETEELPRQTGEGIQIGNRRYFADEEQIIIYQSAVLDSPPYCCICWNPFGDGICQYLAGHESELCYSTNIIDLFGIEQLLLRKRTMILHASFIRWNHRGILFSASSGTGKSTQADLWAKYEGAETINGDRAGIGKDSGRWMAYGLPYAGSSRIYRNESAELSAIVVLRQASENRLFRLKAMEAFRYLYEQVTVHQWEREAVQIATQLLFELIRDVPVYLLECRPDEGAVQLLKAELE